METYALVVVQRPTGDLVLPRRLALRVAPGAGRLAVKSRAPLSPRWTASVAAAWEAARRLTQRLDADGELEVVGDGALDGESAGFPVAVLATYALLERPMPPHFATGAVRLPDGRIEGGLGVLVKGRAIPNLARQLGVLAPRFLVPPVADPPRIDGVDVLPAPDLGTALSRLDAEAYALVRAGHEAMRAAASRALD